MPSGALKPQWKPRPGGRHQLQGDRQDNTPLKQFACGLSASVAGGVSASAEPQWNAKTEGKRQLQGERPDRLSRQLACALKKPPLIRTSENAIPRIRFLLIFISSFPAFW